MPRARSTLLAAAALSLAAACGTGEEKADAGTAVRVNGAVITVAEIADAVGPGVATRPDAMSRSAPLVLEKMIDQKLLAQAALNLKLEREPEVARAIERARQQILAQAYVGRTMSAAAPHSAEDVARFRAQNPALFEERRIYLVQELAINAPARELEAIREQASRTKRLADLATWLRSRGLKYTVNSVTKPAEELPIELLPTLAAMQTGQIAVVPVPTGAIVLQLMDAQRAPLTEAQAKPVIEQFLLNRKRMEVADAEVKRLRANADIQYIGDFKPTGNRAAEPQSPAPAPTASR